MEKRGDRNRKRMKAIYKKWSSIIIIGLVISFAVATVFAVKSFSSPTEANESSEFVTNSAEEYYYNGEYDKAIEAYKKLQNKEDWPIYNIKIAEINSLKGNKEESNRILEDSVIKRYHLFDENGTEKYDDLDNEFCNEVVFTLFMNGEYDKAIEYGEVFLSESNDNYALQRTMFTVYMAKNDKEKAKALIDNYNLDVDSSCELANYAEMQIIYGDWNGGIESLRKAWYVDKEEIRIYDVIEQVVTYDNGLVINKLEELIKDNPKEVGYKILLAKAYSLSKDKTNKAKELLADLEGEDLGKIFTTIKAKIFINDGNTDEGNKLLKKLVDKNKKSYEDYYISAWYYYSIEDYEKALEYCKKSISENEEYCSNYGKLMPAILEATHNYTGAEPYYITAFLKNPLNYELVLNIAEFYGNNLKNIDTAYSYYNLAALINSKDTELYYSMAMLELDNEDVEKAIELLKKCISINNKDTKYYRTLGKIYFDEKNYDEAIKEFRAAYNIDENDILTLNNVACYYILCDSNIQRGFINIEAAYKGLKADTDKEVKEIITDNYTKIKSLRDKYGDDNRGNIILPELEMFY